MRAFLTGASQKGGAAPQGTLGYIRDIGKKQLGMEGPYMDCVEKFPDMCVCRV